ncbi:TIGR00156 family protein [Pasteurellaceae bacterium RH1A]|nr:TIGR00156 family protein [Pasteurellaceae bacterium RH1A]
MKKLLMIALVGAGLAACSKPNHNPNQVFGPQQSNTVVTIAQAKTFNDDSIVLLEGNIVRQIDNDEFIFRDATGEIKIEVEDHAWNGLNVTPQDKIRIQGKLDKEWNKADLDVFRVEKAQ